MHDVKFNPSTLPAVMLWVVVLEFFLVDHKRVTDQRDNCVTLSLAMYVGVYSFSQRPHNEAESTWSVQHRPHASGEY